MALHGKAVAAVLSHRVSSHFVESARRKRWRMGRELMFGDWYAEKLNK